MKAPRVLCQSEIEFAGVDLNNKYETKEGKADHPATSEQ
jgi:hypothetical protein